MLSLKTASEKGPPDGFIPFVNEVPCIARMNLVDGKNKKTNEQLNTSALIPGTEYRNVDIASWLECHKRGMRAINQDPVRPYMMRYFIAEITAQLKVHQKKGTFIDMFDTVIMIVFEVLQCEKNVAKTADRIAKLAFRGGHWTKDFLEKQILAESRGHEEIERMCHGDGESDPQISTGYASSLATNLGHIETADVLHEKMIIL